MVNFHSPDTGWTPVVCVAQLTTPSQSAPRTCQPFLVQGWNDKKKKTLHCFVLFSKRNKIRPQMKSITPSLQSLLLTNTTPKSHLQPTPSLTLSVNWPTFWVLWVNIFACKTAPPAWEGILVFNCISCACFMGVWIAARVPKLAPHGASAEKVREGVPCHRL